MKKDFYTLEEFQNWLKNHPEVSSINKYKNLYKSYNDKKLHNSPVDKYKISSFKLFGTKVFGKKGIYTYEEFQEWLKNHPEVISGKYYSKYRKEYNDCKLPSDTYYSYNKSRSEIFGTNRKINKNPYVYEEFQEWLKNHPEVISGKYYSKHRKEYNDCKLPNSPSKKYNIKIVDLFGNINLSKKLFYTWEEFQEWLKNHPEVISGKYYSKHRKEYYDQKLPSYPYKEYDRGDIEIFKNVKNININKNCYTYVEFQDWLKNHPEVISGKYYSKHYKEYNVSKLPTNPKNIYKKSNSEIFNILFYSMNRNYYTYEEFQEWLINHSEVTSMIYYSEHWKEYNDNKLSSRPQDVYNKPVGEIFNTVITPLSGVKRDYYSYEEFQRWLNIHNEIDSYTYYHKHYKDYNDLKLYNEPQKLYNKPIFEIFGTIQCISSEEKRKIFEQRVQISGNDYFILTVLYGFEMEFDEEKAKSYYKSIGGSDHLIKCFNPNFVPKCDGHRFDGFELSEFPQLTSSDINSIIRFDRQRFFNLNKKSLENDDYSCIEELKNDNMGGEYFIRFKELILSNWNDIQNYKPPTNFKSKKTLTLFQKLTAIDFMG